MKIASPGSNVRVELEGLSHLNSPARSNVSAVNTLQWLLVPADYARAFVSEGPFSLDSNVEE